MEIEGRGKSVTIDELIGMLKFVKGYYGNIEVYYPYDGMNISIKGLEHNDERIEERGMDRGNGYPKYLVPEHILIK